MQSLLSDSNRQKQIFIKPNQRLPRSKSLQSTVRLTPDTLGTNASICGINRILTNTAHQCIFERMQMHPLPTKNNDSLVYPWHQLRWLQK